MGSFSITLDLPHEPAVLFPYLAEPRNRPEWQSSLRAVDEVDDGEPHAGMHWRDVTKVGVKPQMQLTEVTPFRTLAEVGTWRGVDAVLTLRFVKVASGTRLTAEGRVIGRGPFALAAAVAGRLAPGAVEADLRRASDVLAGKPDVQGRGLLFGLGMLVLGGIWTFQGLGYIGGSAMSGEDAWAIIGPRSPVWASP